MAKEHLIILNVESWKLFLYNKNQSNNSYVYIYYYSIVLKILAKAIWHLFPKWYKSFNPGVGDKKLNSIWKK